MGAVIFDHLRTEKPTPQQILFFKSKAKHTAFGGARGGGKSWAGRRKLVMLCMAYDGLRCLLLRRTMPELRENHILPLQQELNGYARYKADEKAFIFPNGSRLVCGYCDTESDMLQYQGQEYEVILFEEATNFREEWITFIRTCLRTTRADFNPRCYYTMNPGGVSHNYFKRLFIDRKFESGENPDDYVYIPAKVSDNPYINADYIHMLEALDPVKRAMHLEGRWDVFAGQFFENFRESPDPVKAAELGVTVEQLQAERRWTHVIDPFEIPQGWTMYRSFDFGYAKPFSCAWWAVDYDGRAYRILELYGCTGTPNEGVKWMPDKIFSEIHRIEQEHPQLKGRDILGVADPSIWDASRGESVYDTACRNQVYFIPGDNARIPGWMQVQYRLQFDEDGYPMMYVFSNCRAFIRTMPLLQYDAHRPEDLDTTAEDHCLTGDTLVLTEGGYKTIESLVGTAGRVISSDGRLHQYSDVRMTRANAEILEIELEDGTTIRCTEDHRLMLPTGEWIEAGNLASATLKTLTGVAVVHAIRRAGRADVYNMEVEDTHDFVIQGGAISHNCADEVRYFCMARPITPQRAKKGRTEAGDDPLELFMDGFDYIRRPRMERLS